MTSYSEVTQVPRAYAGSLALSGLFLCGFLAFGIGAYSFTQFMEPLAAEFHWGRATLGGLMSAFWLSAPFALVSAYLLDRLGVRTLVLIGGAVETIGLAGMILAAHEWQFNLLRFCMGVGKVLMVTPLPAMAARWFPKRPGLAIATSLCGWHVGGLVMAPVSQRLIAANGWRQALVFLACIMLAGIALAAALLREPAGIGADRRVGRTDGSANASAATGNRPALLAGPGGLIAIGLGTIVFYAGYAGLLGQLSPLLTDSGLSARAIGELTGSVAISAAVCVLLAGGLTQWMSPRGSGTLVLVLMGATAINAMALGPMAQQWHVLSVVVLLGALVGAGDPILIEALRRSVTPPYFGRAYGWWYLLCLTALTIAPFAVGAAFDYTGHYLLAFKILGVSNLAIAAVWAVCVPKLSTHSIEVRTS